MEQMKRSWNAFEAARDELKRAARTPGCTSEMLAPWKKLCLAHCVLISSRLLLEYRLGNLHTLLFQMYGRVIFHTIQEIKSTTCHA